MVIVLSAKNKLGFIDDSIEKPYNDNSHLLNFWTRNNNIVISWILNSVSKEISTSTIYSELESDICMTHKTVSNKATNDVFFKYIVSWLTWTKNNFLSVPISQNSNPYGKSWATSVLHAPVEMHLWWTLIIIWRTLCPFLQDLMNSMLKLETNCYGSSSFNQQGFRWSLEKRYKGRLDLSRSQA